MPPFFGCGMLIESSKFYVSIFSSSLHFRQRIPNALKNINQLLRYLDIERAPKSVKDVLSG